MSLITLTESSSGVTFKLEENDIIKVFTNGSQTIVEAVYGENSLVKTLKVDESPAAIDSGSLILISTTLNGGSVYLNKLRVVNTYEVNSLARVTYDNNGDTTEVLTLDVDEATFIAAIPADQDGNGIYTGSNTVPTTVAVTLTDTLSFSGGNVGFGELSPAATVDINGTLKYVDGNQAAGFVLTTDADGNATWQAVSGSANGIFDVANDGGTVPATFEVNLTDTFSFNGGNVGFGTATPSAKIDVVGANDFLGGLNSLYRNNSLDQLFLIRNNGVIEIGENPTATGLLSIRAKNNNGSTIPFYVESSTPTSLYFLTDEGNSTQAGSLKVNNSAIVKTDVIDLYDQSGNYTIGLTTTPYNGITQTAGNVVLRANLGGLGSPNFGNVVFVNEPDNAVPFLFDVGNGRAGIGTTSPLYGLDIQKDTYALNVEGTSPSGGNAFRMVIDQTTARTNGAVAVMSFEGDATNINTAGLQLAMNPLIGGTSPALRIIGTPNAEYGAIFTTKGGSTFVSDLGGTNALNYKSDTGALNVGFIGNANSKLFVYNQNALANVVAFADSTNTKYFRITDAGVASYTGTGVKMGIGTATPSERLSVEGNIEIPIANAYRIKDATNEYDFLRASQGVGSVNIMLGKDASGTDAGNGGFIAIGNNSTSNAEGIAIGLNTSVGTSTFDGIAIGRNASIPNGGIRRIAIGRNATVTGNDSLALGPNVTANAANQFRYGLAATNNIFDGQVGIGTTTPTSKLTVNGDVETLTNSKGFVVLDRTNGNRYRIYTDGGVLNTELVP